MKQRIFLLVVFFVNSLSVATQPTKFQGFFRSGQTFLTWEEDGTQTGESYRIYRSTSKIREISKSILIAEIPEGSSYFPEMHNCDSSLLDTQACFIDRFIIQPVTSGKGIQLSKTTGLFVWTAEETLDIKEYYAITTVSKNGVEETILSDDNTLGPLTEKRQPPDAVRYLVGDSIATDNVQRDYYILWMDYTVWKESFTGYATPLAISNSTYGSHPFSKDKLPELHLDGITTRFPGAHYNNYGNMDFTGNGTPTWYFGYHASKEYDGVCEFKKGITEKDSIGNYVQYKHLQAVLWARRHFGVTKPQFGIEGNSMGASGAFGFYMAFPSFVTGVYCHEGLVQYRNPGVTSNGDMIWAESIQSNYGDPALGNPVKFLRFNNVEFPELDWVTQFNGTNIYDIRDVVKFMSTHQEISFGYLSATHKFQDPSIQWNYNGKPFRDYIVNSRQSFSYGCGPGEHGWQGHIGENEMWKKMRWDESRPGFSAVPPVTDTLGDTLYLVDVSWGTLDGSVMNGKVISETNTSWTLPIISAKSEISVDITPRNLQLLKICSGDTFNYSIMNSSEKVESSGIVVADNLQLLLIPHVPIRPSGTILKVELKGRGSNYPCDQLSGPRHTVGIKKISKIKSNLSVNTIVQQYVNSNVVFSIKAGIDSDLNNVSKFALFDLRGRLVNTLPLGEKTNGSYNVVWDGTNISGHQISKNTTLIATCKVDKSVLITKVLMRK